MNRKWSKPFSIGTSPSSKRPWTADKHHHARFSEHHTRSRSKDNEKLDEYVSTPPPNESRYYPADQKLFDDHKESPKFVQKVKPDQSTKQNIGEAPKCQDGREKYRTSSYENSYWDPSKTTNFN